MSNEVVVDIRTRFLRDDQRCYILFPGDGYRFYDDMKNNDVVFLDVPGFQMRDGENLRQAGDLIERVIISERISRWHYDGRPEDKLPPRHFSELENYKTTTRRRQFAGQVRGFFHNIKEGDIVIVPCQQYEDDVLFGEILKSKNQQFVSISRYPGEKIPARPVRWVTRMRRDSIPMWLDRKIPSPNPLRQIESIYFDEIFDAMFERYFFNGRFVCKFSVSSKEFSALDNFLFQQIVLYIAALHEGRETNNISNISSKSLSSIVSELAYSEDIPDQRISINSPGHIILYSRNIIPLVAGVFMTLAATPGLSSDLTTVNVLIKNSADNSRTAAECISDVQDEVMDDMTTMGYRRWQELCSVEAQARRRTQISSGMSAAQGPDQSNGHRGH